jgi:hypothetical protein
MMRRRSRRVVGLPGRRLDRGRQKEIEQTGAPVRDSSGSSSLCSSCPALPFDRRSRMSEIPTDDKILQIVTRIEGILTKQQRIKMRCGPK